ncbi:MAG: FecR domain-containing protein [Planctomycetes bacterium]|nr:FecR domain-containing protein [Planctomycetota bacterium]
MRGPIRFMSVMAVLAWAFLGSSAQAQRSIGRVHRFSGEFEIQHEGHILVPAKAGPLFRNANLYSGDTVRTGRGAAELLFEDASMLKMDSHTVVQLDESKLGAGERSERNIRVVVGRVWCKIRQSSGKQQTIFEVPDGVAAVRGTILEVWVDDLGNWDIYVHEGMVEVTDYRVGAMFAIFAGCGVELTQMGENEVELKCHGAGKGTVKGMDVFFRAAPIYKPDGSVMLVPPMVKDFTDGDVLRVTHNPDGTYEFTEVQGKVAVLKIRPGEDTLLLPWWLDDPVIPRRLVGSPGIGRAGEGGLPPATVINPGG